jgi:hypothetical protein
MTTSPDRPTRRALGSILGRAILVQIGWYATLFSAFAIVQAGLPVDTSAACQMSFGCVRGQASVMLVLYVAVPFGLAGTVVGLPIAAGTAWLSRSAVVAGTVAAWATVILTLASLPVLGGRHL